MRQKRAIFVFSIPIGRNAKRGGHLLRSPTPLLSQALYACDVCLIELLLAAPDCHGAIVPMAAPPVFGQRGLDTLDDLSNHWRMETNLTWKLVDDTAADLGAGADARLKWRQRGVPPKWRIRIVETLMARSVPVSLADFDKLDLTPGRIAA